MNVSRQRTSRVDRATFTHILVGTDTDDSTYIILWYLSVISNPYNYPGVRPVCRNSSNTIFPCSHDNSYREKQFFYVISNVS